MLEEGVIFDNTELAPKQFQKMLNKFAEKFNVKDFKDIEATDGDVVIRFGETVLPIDKNVVNIGGKYYNKEIQYKMLKNVVPTIKTFSDYVDDVGDFFIAKKKTGMRQQGQLDSKIPDDSSDYIFQPKVKILKEYRVIVFYMNGDYHVSGIYEKTGSNVSLKSISSERGKVISDIAIKATQKLGYGFSGSDIAIVHAKDKKNINETVVGKFSQLVMRGMGNLSNYEKILSENYPVLLEVNSYPSVANPTIAQDLLDSIQNEVR